MRRRKIHYLKLKTSSLIIINCLFLIVKCKCLYFFFFFFFNYASSVFFPNRVCVYSSAYFFHMCSKFVCKFHAYKGTYGQIGIRLNAFGCMKNTLRALYILSNKKFFIFYYNIQNKLQMIPYFKVFKGSYKKIKTFNSVINKFKIFQNKHFYLIFSEFKHTL